MFFLSLSSTSTTRRLCWLFFMNVCVCVCAPSKWTQHTMVKCVYGFLFCFRIANGTVQVLYMHQCTATIRHSVITSFIYELFECIAYLRTFAVCFHSLPSKVFLCSFCLSASQCVPFWFLCSYVRLCAGVYIFKCNFSIFHPFIQMWPSRTKLKL